MTPEDYLIGCCLIDEGATLDAARKAGLRPHHLQSRPVIYSHLLRMREEGVPIGLETLVPRLGDSASMADLLALTDPANVPTTARASHHIRELLKAATVRQEIQKAQARIEALQRGEVDLPDVAEAARCPARPITSYAYPCDDDPSMLLGSDDYLGRGGGLLFVSHAGAGKSSWALDAVMTWGLGEPWMGIKAAKPLKALVVQSEDSDRYIGKIFGSFAHVRKLTPAQTEQLAQNVVMVRLKGVSGDKFFEELKRLVDLHQPDLVVINPLYLYADGDITRSEYAQPFLIKLDAVNKDEKFAYILIHHTGKPAAKQNNGKRATVEDWESAYMGFGSSYLANWPRATVLLEPVPGHIGKFQIKLGKGGLNAGVTREVRQGVGVRHEPTTRIAIRHSQEKMLVGGKERRVYYWEIDTEPPPEAVEKPKGGRPSKHQISSYMQFIPGPKSEALPAPQIHRSMGSATGIALTSFCDMLFKAAERGEVYLTSLPGKGYCYHRMP